MAEHLQRELAAGTFARVTLSRPIGGQTAELSKATAEPIDEPIDGPIDGPSGGGRVTITTTVGDQQRHETLAAAAAVARLESLFAGFRQADILGSRQTTLKRKGERVKVAVGKATPAVAAADSPAARPAHNRDKQRLLAEDAPFLRAIGLADAEGRIKPTGRRKFRQIARYVELVADLQPVLEPIAAERPLSIVDFGCGRSYLTFAVWHLFANVLRLPATIAGLDLKADVIADCQRIARDLGCGDLSFAVGEIAGYASPGPIDLCISLHACDTATDAALAQAVRWKTPAILAVPCCQHELNAGLSPATSEPLRPLLRHGLLKERVAALATDALRAARLELAGYRCQAVEFIDLEHTAKNVLLRATPREAWPSDVQAAREREYAALKTLFGVETFALERLLAG